MFLVAECLSERSTYLTYVLKARLEKKTLISSKICCKIKIICSMYKILLYRHKYIKSRETLRFSTFPICITKIGKQTMGSHLKCIHTTFRIYTLCIYIYIYIYIYLHIHISSSSFYIYVNFSNS